MVPVLPAFRGRLHKPPKGAKREEEKTGLIFGFYGAREENETGVVAWPAGAVVFVVIVDVVVGVVVVNVV